MENWTITPLGHFSKSARHQFGACTVTVVQGPMGGSWRIETGGGEIARHIAPLPTKSIDEAIAMATAQIKALIDALAPFSALATELAEAEAVIASTRALLEESKAALARQAARIEALEAKAEADADSRRWNVEMCAWGPWDADREEGGQ